MAFRVLASLAVICALAAIALFSLRAFSSVLAVALAVVFALGAVVARTLNHQAASAAAASVEPEVSADADLVEPL
jgi:hypothetical protein